MTVNVTKPQINLRDKLSELDKPSGIAGEAILRSETPQEVFNYINAGRRNLIINGDFQVAQRSTGSVSVSDGSNETYATVDRWYANFGTSQGGSVDTQQITVNSDGIKNAWRIDCTGTATPTGNQNFSLNTKLEIADVSPFLYNGSPATLSFKVRTNRGGTYATTIFVDAATDRNISKNFYVTGGEQWEDVELTFPANTLSLSSPLSMIVSIYLSSGPDRIDSNLSGWSTYDGDTISAAIDNFFDSTDNFLELSNVQLEFGKVATPFEHRSYGEELALCQRYFQRFGQASGASGYPKTAVGIYASNAVAYAPVSLYQPFRAAPTLSDYGGAWGVYSPGSATATVNSIGLNFASNNLVSIAINITAGTGGTTGTPMMIQWNNTASYFDLDAEL